MILSPGRRALLAPGRRAGRAALVPTGRSQQPLPPEFLEGTQIFRRILLDMGFTPLTQGKEVAEQPAQTILIVLGDPRNSLGLGQLKTFVENGGAVLFASDQVVSDPDLGSALRDLTGYAIWGQTVVCEKGAEIRFGEDIRNWNRSPRYQNLEACPFLVSPEGAAPALLYPGGLRQEGELRVATNRPSYLLKRDGKEQPHPLPALAYLPTGCFPNPRQWQGGVDREIPAKTPVVVGGEPPIAGLVGGTRGRILLVADHSIFINMMMLAPDTNNIEFTSNCLEYLRDPQGANRNRVLFLEEGKVNSNFDIPLKNLPGLSEQGLRAILASMNERLAHLEDQNAFDRALAGVLDKHTTTGQMLHVGIVVLTLALLTWFVWRLLRVRGYRTDSTVPLLAETAGATVPAPLLEQRQQEILKSDNLWANARQVARAAFLAAGVSAPVGALHPPVIRVAGGLWQRWRRQRQVLRLWRLAFDPRPVRVRSGQWPSLLVELGQLQAELADGSVQVEMAA